MDIDAADRLYRTFHKTNEGAKFKQGLGFGSGGGGGVGAAQPGKWKKNAEAPSTSGFVKQGEGPALAVSSVNAAASTQREREERAARVAQRMAELKQLKKGSSSGAAPVPSKRHRLDKAEDRVDPVPLLPRGGLASGSGRKAEGVSLRESFRESLKESLDKKREEGKTGVQHGSASRGSGRRGEDKEREREKGSYRKGDRGGFSSEGSRRDREREREDGREGRRGLKGSSRSSVPRDAAPPSQARPAKTVDYGRHIPGYEAMGPAAKLQARTRYDLQEADRASRRRSRKEAEEDEETAKAEGRESGGPVRQWTRYNFNAMAPLAKESQPRSSGALDARDIAGTAAELGIEKEGEVLNPLGASAVRDAEQVKKRDLDHSAAIFGEQQQQQQQQQRGSSGNGSFASRKHEELQKQTKEWAGVAGGTIDRDALAELARREGWNEDDGPVVVTSHSDDAHAQQQQQQQQQAATEVISNSISCQQKGMSWRERAKFLQAKKPIAPEPPAPPPLQISWRDKAKGKGRGGINLLI